MPFESAYDDLYTAHGVAAVFRAVPADVGRAVLVRTTFDGADKAGSAMTVKVRRSDVSQLIYGHSFEIDGVRWTVRTVLAAESGTNAWQWAGQCSADERAPWAKG